MGLEKSIRVTMGVVGLLYGVLRNCISGNSNHMARISEDCGLTMNTLGLVEEHPKWGKYVQVYNQDCCTCVGSLSANNYTKPRL
jgi:hypothetical protein